MQGAHDLSTAPSLVEAQVADEIRNLEAAVGASSRGEACRRRSRQTACEGLGSAVNATIGDSAAEGAGLM